MSTELPEPVATFVDAVNRGDTEAFLSRFTLDGVVDDWGRRFTGRDAIRGWSDAEFIGAQGQMTVSDTSRDGADVVVVADWRSTHANGLSRFVFTLDGELVRQMRITAG
jgi:hypothetical protein